jgi:hypothetical protein
MLYILLIRPKYRCADSHRSIGETDRAVFPDPFESWTSHCSSHIYGVSCGGTFFAAVKAVAAFLKGVAPSPQETTSPYGDTDEH